MKQIHFLLVENNQNDLNELLSFKINPQPNMIQMIVCLTSVQELIFKNQISEFYCIYKHNQQLKCHFK
jgi:hypothetical protein